MAQPLAELGANSSRAPLPDPSHFGESTVLRGKLQGLERVHVQLPVEPCCQFGTYSGQGLKQLSGLKRALQSLQRPVRSISMIAWPMPRLIPANFEEACQSVRLSNFPDWPIERLDGIGSTTIGRNAKAVRQL